jgi:Spy/CpxP family protein refolding chaperone
LTEGSVGVILEVNRREGDPRRQTPPVREPGEQETDMFWKHKWAFAHGHGCGGPKHHHGHDHESHSRGGWGGFGVRRPLRFMARQLELDEEQVDKLAAILDDLKTERAQAKVDHRRAVSSFADAFVGDELDVEKVKKAANERADSARRVEEAVVVALERTFALLSKEQRKRLAYLLRSEALQI